mgnify:CR=1 FL=1
MIREMKPSDWEEMSKIYTQSLEKGNVTFTTDCPSYEQWDSAHAKECRFVYEENGHILGYTMIAPTSSRVQYKGVAELSIFVDKDHLKKGIGTIIDLSTCIWRSRSKRKGEACVEL